MLGLPCQSWSLCYLLCHSWSACERFSLERQDEKWLLSSLMLCYHTSSASGLARTPGCLEIILGCSELWVKLWVSQNDPSSSDSLANFQLHSTFKHLLGVRFCPESSINVSCLQDTYSVGKGQKIYTIICTTKYRVVSAIKERPTKASRDLKWERLILSWRLWKR